MENPELIENSQAYMLFGCIGGGNHSCWNSFLWVFLSYVLNECQKTRSFFFICFWSTLIFLKDLLWIFMFVYKYCTNFYFFLSFLSFFGSTFTIFYFRGKFFFSILNIFILFYFFINFYMEFTNLLETFIFV